MLSSKPKPWGAAPITRQATHGRPGDTAARDRHAGGVHVVLPFLLELEIPILWLNKGVGILRTPWLVCLARERRQTEKT